MPSHALCYNLGMADKIINTFQQRRQLAQDLEHLAQTTNEAQLIAGARALVGDYPADLLATTLLKHLDTPNSQLRGGLGHLAALLPPEVIVPALHSATASRANAAQARFTAALILERYLGETVSPALLADLNQTNEVAFQSLREAVEESVHNRRVLLDYVTQMRQTPDSIAFMVMDLMERLEPAQRVDLYRLMALDDRPVVARAALQRLERLAADAPAPVLAALTSLTAMLPPDLSAQSERSLRKLQFSGLRYQPPAAHGWRCLISPADLGAHMSVWFVRMPEKGAQHGLLLGMILHPQQGVVQAFGNDMLGRSQLPKVHAVGKLVTVRTDDHAVATLLEASFDVGRTLLATAHAAQTAGHAPALPGDYRLYGDSLWLFAAPQVGPDLALHLAALQPDAESQHAAAAMDPAALIDDARVLLTHPVMAGWVLHPRMFLPAVGTEARPPRMPFHELAQVVLRELEQRPERSQITATLALGLRLQALWLTIAGHPAMAGRATRLAAAMPHLALSVNPLLTLLVEGSLRQAESDNTGLV